MKKSKEIVATPQSKTNKLSQLKQTDGRDDSPEVNSVDNRFEPGQTRPKTLAQFFGETIAGRYKTTNEEEYTNFLKTLNKSDLYEHAIKCNLAPKDDRQRLVAALIREFKRTVASYKPLPVLKQHDKDNKKITAETMRILAQGR